MTKWTDSYKHSETLHFRLSARLSKCKVTNLAKFCLYLAYFCCDSLHIPSRTLLNIHLTGRRREKRGAYISKVIEKTEKNKTFSIHLPIAICHSARARGKKVSAESRGGGKTCERFVQLWQAHLCQKLHLLVLITKDFLAMQGGGTLQSWKEVAWVMETSRSLMNRDTLFTLSSLYKSKSDSLERKGNYSSRSSANYPKFNKAADPCSAALLLRTLQGKIHFQVILVVIFNVKTLLHKKQPLLPESSAHPFYIRQFRGWRRYDSTHDYLWLFERGPRREIKKKQ